MNYFDGNPDSGYEFLENFLLHTKGISDKEKINLFGVVVSKASS